MQLPARHQQEGGSLREGPPVQGLPQDELDSHECISCM
jgi:hypothetical protein